MEIFFLKKITVDNKSTIAQLFIWSSSLENYVYAHCVFKITVNEILYHINSNKSNFSKFFHVFNSLTGNSIDIQSVVVIYLPFSWFVIRFWLIIYSHLKLLFQWFDLIVSMPIRIKLAQSWIDYLKIDWIFAQNFNFDD